MKSGNGRDLVKDAVRDADSLKKAVLENAKREIVESMAPALRQLLERSVRGGMLREDTDRLRRGVQDGYPGESHTGFEEGSGKEGGVEMADKKDKELDMESLAGFFPQISETEDPEDPFGKGGAPMEAAGPDDMPYESAIPTLGEEPVAEGEKADDEDEEIEISEAELRKVYEAALQTEVEVKKGFGEMTKAGELDDVSKDVDKGIADVKKGDANWDGVEPPAKQDFTVKEMIRRGMAENKRLRKSLVKAESMIKVLATRLHEVNLFNSKVMHVNRILNTTRLTNEQKKVVMESIDRAENINEVKKVYQAIVGSLQASRPLAEQRTRRPLANAQRARTSGAPGAKVISESRARAAAGDPTVDRLKLLAGLTK